MASFCLPHTQTLHAQGTGNTAHCIHSEHQTLHAQVTVHRTHSTLHLSHTFRLGGTITTFTSQASSFLTLTHIYVNIPAHYQHNVQCTSVQWNIKIVAQSPKPPTEPLHSASTISNYYIKPTPLQWAAIKLATPSPPPHRLLHDPTPPHDVVNAVLSCCCPCHAVYNFGSQMF